MGFPRSLPTYRSWRRSPRDFTGASPRTGRGDAHRRWRDAQAPRVPTQRLGGFPGAWVHTPATRLLSSRSLPTYRSWRRPTIEARPQRIELGPHGAAAAAAPTPPPPTAAPTVAATTAVARPWAPHPPRRQQTRRLPGQRRHGCARPRPAARAPPEVAGRRVGVRLTLPRRRQSKSESHKPRRRHTGACWQRRRGPDHARHRLYLSYQVCPVTHPGAACWQRCGGLKRDRHRLYLSHQVRLVTHNALPAGSAVEVLSTMDIGTTSHTECVL